LNDSADERLVATVHGRVQGVGFRWFVRRQAEHLGIVGWVANRADSAVEVVAEGPRATLDMLESRLREGPLAASVASVDLMHEPARGNLVGFEVRSGAHRGD
jgi:acylphosphatase